MLTPLGWSVWGAAGEKTMRRIFHAIGGMPRSFLEVPEDSRDRVINIFFGRIAINVDTFVQIGNVMPGTTGADVAQQFLGEVPREFETRSQRKRLPFIAARFPRVFLTTPRRALRLHAATDRWYADTVGTVGELSLEAARALFASARDRFDEAVFVQTLTSFAVVQPVYTQLVNLADRASVDVNPLMAGHGAHAESHLLADLWSCSRGRLDLETFVRRHGYHGPGEGEIGGTVWRDDPEPLVRVLRTYAQMDDTRDPANEAPAKVAEREAAEATLLKALPASRRPAARLVLALAARHLSLRGYCKIAFLESLDVCRLAARRIGDLLHASGAVGDPSDVLYLTCAELLDSGSIPDVDVIGERRAERERYLGLSIPVSWQGDPVPLAEAELLAGSSKNRQDLHGLGVSSGIVRGRARVVLDPVTADVEEGDVLVAHTTDPSWASLMYAASALVVDIGGALSHAAVVARELGIPCVMGIDTATRTIPDGALIEVDGARGVVEILDSSVANAS